MHANFSIHGFAYWFSAKKMAERIFWIIIVVFGIACGGLILKSTVDDWIT